MKKINLVPKKLKVAMKMNRNLRICSTNLAKICSQLSDQS
jgi:hypothetical protein